MTNLSLFSVTEIELVYRNKQGARDRPAVRTSQRAYDLFLASWDMNRIDIVEQFKILLATALALGSFLFPLGVLLQTLMSGSTPRVLAVAGSGLVIVSLAGMTVGFARGHRA